VVFLDEKFCFASTRKDNFKSIHACKNAGFTEVRSVIEDGYPCLVLQKELEFVFIKANFSRPSPGS